VTVFSAEAKDGMTEVTNPPIVVLSRFCKAILLNTSQQQQKQIIQWLF